MSVESAADRAAFLETDAFGETLTWTPAGEDPVTGIACQFFDGTKMVEGFDGPMAQGRDATVWMAEDDLPSGYTAGDDGDAVTVAGNSYSARSIEPDGMGMVVVRLEKVAS